MRFAPYPGEVVVIVRSDTLDDCCCLGEVVSSSKFGIVLKQADSNMVDAMAAHISTKRSCDLGDILGAVEVAINRPSGLYRFGSDLRRQGAEYRLTYPKDILRLQRRREYRQPINFTTRFVQGQDKCRGSARIVDLSGGGALITTPNKIVQNYVTIDIPTGREGCATSLTANVIEVRELAEGKEKVARLQFEDENLHLSEAVREEIVRYVFEQQRMMLKLRKLIKPASTTEIRATRKNARLLSDFADWLRAPS